MARLLRGAALLDDRAGRDGVVTEARCQAERKQFTRSHADAHSDRSPWPSFVRTRALTPELSRAALRPWASETQRYLHEAAKRARLERIVSHYAHCCVAGGDAVIDGSRYEWLYPPNEAPCLKPMDPVGGLRGEISWTPQVGIHAQIVPVG